MQVGDLVVGDLDGVFVVGVVEAVKPSENPKQLTPDLITNGTCNYPGVVCKSYQSSNCLIQKYTLH